MRGWGVLICVFDVGVDGRHDVSNACCAGAALYQGLGVNEEGVRAMESLPPEDARDSLSTDTSY